MTLAIHGGKRVRDLPLPSRPQYTLAERNAANYVVGSGNLSGFLAEEGEAFLGGYHVQALEKAWCEHFQVKHAIAMNSATSCLFGATRALGIGRGDEVVVTPWSMSASATCAIAAGAKPVFADIEHETYGLSAHSYCGAGWAIGPRTKAIVAVDLFGCVPRDIEELMAFGIPVIEDAAQAIGATNGKHSAGTIGDIGVYSLNRHKIIQCGEGGIAVTNNSELAERLRLYRNHGEVLGSWWPGGNYRLGEIEAAIALVQLDRLTELTEPRRCNAERLTDALQEVKGIRPPTQPEGYLHSYYLYAMRVKEVPALRFAEALSAEGVSASTYVAPLYRLPIFGRPARTHFPEVERAYREVVVLPHVHAAMTDEDLDDVIEATRKVWQHRNEL